MGSHLTHDTDGMEYLMKWIIEVTNFQGSVLYVNSTAYRGSTALNFGVKVRKYAKRFSSEADALHAIRSFNPSMPQTTFRVVPA